MKKIDISTPTYSNTFALVDDADFEWLNQWKWHPHSTGQLLYVRRTANGKGLLMHRLIVGNSSKKTDHRDRNGLNNQRFNLRTATHAQNMANRKIQRNNKSGYKGVCWSKQAKKWRAQIKINGKGRYLGEYFCLIKAAKAYDEVAKENYGEFARTNF